MELHDWITLLLIAALVVYVVGIMLINANIRAQRRYRRKLISEVLKKGDEFS